MVFAEVNEALGYDLGDIMLNGSQELLTNTENAQPAIMCASVAILRVLEKEVGLIISNQNIDYVAGHSLGEYTALCAAGIFNLADTTKLLKVRGEAFRDIGEKSNGGMVALVGATIEQAEEVAKLSQINGMISQVANDNTVGQVVISGNKECMQKSLEIAKTLGIKRAIELPVSGAFHSELMKPAIDKMMEILADMQLNAMKIPVIANFTAEVESVNEVVKNLLAQITGRVKWRETMLKMENEGVETFVEIGSGKILSNMVGKTCPDVKTIAINSIETMKEYLDTLK